MPFIFRSRLALVPSLLLFVAVLSMGRAAAQPNSEPPGYRSAVDEALVEYRTGHFLEARALFTEAHQIFPNARTLRGLGMTAFELRKYRETVEYLEQALLSPIKPLDGRLRSETEGLLQRAYRFVARVKLVLTPPTTVATIDGHLTPLEPGKALLLEPGSHAFVFTADGHAPEQRDLDVKGREIVTWTIQLHALPPPPPPRPIAAPPVLPAPREVAAAAQAQPSTEPKPFAPPVAPEPPPRRHIYKNPWLWVGVGVGVTALAVGIGIAASGNKRTVEDQPVRTPGTPPGGTLSTLWSAL